MADELLNRSLQENIIALLAHNDQYGNAVRKMVTPELFEGDYRTIAERMIEFWENHNTAPKQHSADLFSDIINNKSDRRAPTYRRILVAMVEVHETINVDYVLRSLSEYIRWRRAQAITYEVATQLSSRGINSLPDVDALLSGYLRERTSDTDAGMRFNEVDRVLTYFENVHNEFKTGIKELDQGYIVPMRGKLMLWLAPAGFGKTWALIQCGKQAFLLRKKICHITLEIDSEEVIQRYYQNLFGASKRDDFNKITTLKFDRNKKLVDHANVTVATPFTFMSPAIREELQVRIDHFGTRAENLIVKRFPMRSLTVDQLEAYLENLEAVDKFVPDILIIDYPGIMKTDEKNHRISMGRLMENLKGLATRRNCAVVGAHQTAKVSVNADMVRSTHVSEDWSIIGTADTIITYSRTNAEKKFGLARLFVDKARSEEDKFGVLITQSYRTGQFVLESTRLDDAYVSLMERIRETAPDAETDDSEE